MKLIGFQNHPSTGEPAAVIDLSRGFRPPLPAAAFAGQMLRVGVSNFNDITRAAANLWHPGLYTLPPVCVLFLRCVRGDCVKVVLMEGASGCGGP